MQYVKLFKDVLASWSLKIWGWCTDTLRCKYVCLLCNFGITPGCIVALFTGSKYTSLLASCSGRCMYVLPPSCTLPSSPLSTLGSLSYLSPVPCPSIIFLLSGSQLGLNVLFIAYFILSLLFIGYCAYSCLDIRAYIAERQIFLSVCMHLLC